MRTRFSLLFFWSWFFLTAQNRQPVHLACKDANFNQEVKDWLQFTVPVISVQQLAGQSDQYVILDARETEEFAISHIKGAILVGYDKFNLNQIPKLGENKRIVVYCSIGYRSEKIAEKLKKAGYKQVYNLYGGIFEWVNNAFPVFNAQDRAETRLHTFNQKWSKWVLNPDVQKVWAK